MYSLECWVIAGPLTVGKSMYSRGLFLSTKPVFCSQGGENERQQKRICDNERLKESSFERSLTVSSVNFLFCPFFVSNPSKFNCQSFWQFKPIGAFQSQETIMVSSTYIHTDLRTGTYLCVCMC